MPHRQPVFHVEHEADGATLPAQLMKGSTMNVAQIIRFNLGCDVSRDVQMPVPKKSHTVAYGAMLKAHFDMAHFAARQRG